MDQGLFDGLTLGGPAPEGFRRESHARRISADPQDFAAARTALFDWQVQRRSGLRVLGPDGRDAPPVAGDAQATLRIPLPLGAGLRAPVRVVRIIDEERLAGFVYRAEPGHPEHGEEAFLVRIEPSGAVRIEIETVSRPALPFALAAPIARRIQRHYTDRYLRALEPVGEAAPR